MYRGDCKFAARSLYHHIVGSDLFELAIIIYWLMVSSKAYIWTNIAFWQQLRRFWWRFKAFFRRIEGYEKLSLITDVRPRKSARVLLGICANASHHLFMLIDYFDMIPIGLIDSTGEEKNMMMSPELIPQLQKSLLSPPLWLSVQPKKRQKAATATICHNYQRVCRPRKPSATF